MPEKKLNLFSMYVIKIHQSTNKMPCFKDELTATVDSVRKNIKTEAINYFINTLKTAMRNTAEIGETKGAIALRINFMEDEDDEYVVLRRLNDLLLFEKVKRTKTKIEEGFEGPKIYEWLVKQIDKIGVFEGIYITLNIDKYEVEFWWDDDEETEE